VEDLAQETFLEAFRAVRDGVKPANFASWLFGIAHNRCGKWLRRKRPILFEPAKCPDLGQADPGLNATDEREAIEIQLGALDAGLEQLPEDARQLLTMKHQRGLTCEQISRELGRPVGTIKSLLSRTYKTMRSILAPHLGQMP
jgi:RNA polymerase sigma-70 factor (ECF subfamily)